MKIENNNSILVWKNKDQSVVKIIMKAWRKRDGSGSV